MKKQKFTLTKEQLEEAISNFDPTKDETLKKIIELGRNKHISFVDAIKLIEKE